MQKEDSARTQSDRFVCLNRRRGGSGGNDVNSCTMKKKRTLNRPFTKAYSHTPSTIARHPPTYRLHGVLGDEEVVLECVQRVPETVGPDVLHPKGDEEANHKRIHDDHPHQHRADFCMGGEARCKVVEEEMLASPGIQTTTSTIRMSKTRFDASICAYDERQQRQQQQQRRRKKQTSSDVIERVLDGLLAVQRRAIVGRVVNSVVVVPHAIFLVSALSSRAHATLGRFSLTKIVPTPLTLIHSRPLVNRVTGQTQSCRSRNCTFRGALAQTRCRAGCA